MLGPKVMVTLLWLLIISDQRPYRHYEVPTCLQLYRQHFKHVHKSQLKATEYHSFQEDNGVWSLVLSNAYILMW